MHWILEKGHVPREVGFEEWLVWVKKNGGTSVCLKRDRMAGVTISTVFLGPGHSLEADGLPILFETLIFGGRLNRYRTHYAMWDKAVKGYAGAVAKVEKTLNNETEK